jgi:hypothetical protein
MTIDSTENTSDEQPDESTLRAESSMTTWWPHLKDIDVPTPQTVRIPSKEVEIDDGAPATDGTVTKLFPCQDEFARAIETVGGPPAFYRDDQMSAKHRMDGGSRITSTDPTDFRANIGEVFEAHQMAWGVPDAEAFYIREWLPLKHTFTAFSGTPIASELRVFIYEGSVHDLGFYWPHDAIRNPDTDNWQDELAKLRESTLNEKDTVIELAERVADTFDGYWSVDFAQTDTGDWHCIDMARGEVSYHPESCDKPTDINTDS